MTREEVLKELEEWAKQAGHYPLINLLKNYRMYLDEIAVASEP